MLAQLERRFRWMAVPNLTLYLVIGQTVFFAVGLVQPDILFRLVLERDLVWGGEVWRLVLFMFMPAVFPDDGVSVLFMFIAMYLLWLMGTALENEWGSFRYTLFILIGYLATLGAVFLVPGGPATNRYILTSIFLAFAVLYPDFTLHLFFILPVKVKWLALLTWIFLAVAFFRGGWLSKGLIVASVLNYLVFFWPYILQRVKGGHRRMKMQREAARAEAEPFHRCVVCGRTDRSDGDVEFRYARTDDGVQCFCMEHLPSAESAG